MSDELIGRGLLQPSQYFAIPNDGMSPAEELRTVLDAARNGTLEDFIIAMGMDLNKVQKDHLQAWENTRQEMLVNQRRIQSVIDGTQVKAFEDEMSPPSPEDEARLASLMDRLAPPFDLSWMAFELPHIARRHIPDLDICSLYLTPIVSWNDMPKSTYRICCGKAMRWKAKKGRSKRTHMVVVRPRLKLEPLGLDPIFEQAIGAHDGNDD